MLQGIKTTDTGTYKITLMKDQSSGQLWIHTNNYKSNINSTLVKLADIPSSATALLTT